MALDNKPLDEIIENDLQELIANKVAESKTIDYKQTLPGTSDKSKTDFLIDITAFANTAGGHLVYGVKEDNGIPTEICGLDIKDPDAEIRRLDDMIRNGITPRVPGMHIRAIPLQSSKSVIVVRIPRSFNPPHMVSFNKERLFYGRSSAGNYPLDVPELRSLFLLSETTAQRIRNFRMERLGKIKSEETPVPLLRGPKYVLHMIPFDAFSIQPRYDLSRFAGRPPDLPNIGCSTGDGRYNFDGFVSHHTYIIPQKPTPTHSYTQCFRNGIIEAVYMGCDSKADKVERFIDIGYETKITQTVKKFLKVQRDLGVAPPVFVLLTLMGVKGFPLARRDRNTLSIVSDLSYVLFEHDDLVLPEVILEGFESDVSNQMQSIFDIVLNAVAMTRQNLR